MQTNRCGMGQKEDEGKKERDGLEKEAWSKCVRSENILKRKWFPFEIITKQMRKEKSKQQNNKVFGQYENSKFTCYLDFWDVACKIL